MLGGIWFIFAAGFIGAVFLTLLITPLVMKLASRLNIFTFTRFASSGGSSIPLLGGLSIFFAFCLTLFITWHMVRGMGDILDKHVFGLAIGGLWIMIGGYLDDKYSLPPATQLIWPFFAILTVIMSGIGITYITNPLAPEKLIYLNSTHLDIIWWKGLPYRLTPIADIFTFVWLYLIMYATKLQDGLDGLVSGISAIGAIFIFLISWFVFRQADLALLAIIFAGAMFGFLYFNKYPARIFLGEGGSILAGYMLGVLAILSNAKVIITLIILSLPIIDALWAIIRRLKKGHAPWKGDQEHLHHLLVKRGLEHKKAVWVLYLFTILFGVLVLLWQSSFSYYFNGLAIIVFLLIFSLFGIVHKGRV